MCRLRTGVFRPIIGPAYGVLLGYTFNLISFRGTVLVSGIDWNYASISGRGTRLLVARVRGY